MKILDLETNECIHDLNCDDYIENIGILPNGTIATFDKKKLKIWNQNTGQCIFIKSDFELLDFWCLRIYVLSNGNIIGYDSDDIYDGELLMLLT